MSAALIYCVMWLALLVGIVFFRTKGESFANKWPAIVGWVMFGMLGWRVFGKLLDF